MDNKKERTIIDMNVATLHFTQYYNLEIILFKQQNTQNRIYNVVLVNVDIYG